MVDDEVVNSEAVRLWQQLDWTTDVNFKQVKEGLSASVDIWAAFKWKYEASTGPSGNTVITNSLHMNELRTVIAELQKREEAGQRWSWAQPTAGVKLMILLIYIVSPAILTQHT